MSFGICALSVIPCRAEGNDRAEIVTQLLFGEQYKVLEVQEKWVHIETILDQYQAWICIKQHSPISDTEFEKISQSSHPRSADLISFVSHNEENINITLGALLTNLKDGTLNWGKGQFSFNGAISENTTDQVEKYAMMYLNTPYLWGGRSPFGIDCSGFTQVVFQLCGIQLPRDAYQQAEIGETIGFVQNTRLGDLAYFDNAEGRITHVGLLLDNQKIIHASGKVRIDKLDHNGIFNEETGKYTHQLRIIKRIF